MAKPKRMNEKKRKTTRPKFDLHSIFRMNGYVCEKCHYVIYDVALLPKLKCPKCHSKGFGRYPHSYYFMRISVGKEEMRLMYVSGYETPEQNLFDFLMKKLKEEYDSQDFKDHWEFARYIQNNLGIMVLYPFW